MATPANRTTSLQWLLGTRLFAVVIATVGILILIQAGGCSSPAATSRTSSTGSDQLRLLPNASTSTNGTQKPTSGAPTSLEQVDAQNAATTIDSTSTGSGPIVLFDVAHREIFGPKNTSELGQSAAVARMRSAGVRVVATHTPFTSAMLRGVSGVMISGNMQPLDTNELAALNDFMTGGGVVVVTVHIAPMDQNIARAFGFALSPQVLQATTPQPGGNPLNFACTSIEQHPLTQGISAVKVLGAWGIAAQPPSQILVGTSADTWIDVDGDGKRTTNDMAGKFGMVGLRQIGKGAFIISGDDAVFANVALASKDNVQLFDNIVKAIKPPTQ
jgi:Domain of unknown function (DUF4350)